MDDEPVSVVTSPEVALETRGFVLLRWLRTFGQAFAPRHTAGGFARSTRLGAPIAFLLTSWLPLAFARGIIPFTHTLRFGDRFGIEHIGEVDRDAIVFDILRAGGLSLLVQTAVLVAMLASYASLNRAYGHLPEGAAGENQDALRRFAVRAILYRAFWLPLGGSFGLAMPILWAVSSEALQSGVLQVVLVLVATAPVMMLFVGLRHAARQACGVGPLVSFAVVAVPFVLGFVVEQILVGDQLGGLLQPWLPELLPAPETVG
ncbi:MAG: hypothetical protein H6721_15390 [Sandaracinus sp.]|nr:hypothetical protein [Sandaracinus sp.]MCB9612368.1 hypothetical protein [Sandaracinus sp.]MCB9624221.1 hypothetical protein [Sandaracinus sp.]MCB9633499.1 hypothetical protein [Sandaracinus sp.]